MIDLLLFAAALYLAVVLSPLLLAALFLGGWYLAGHAWRSFLLGYRRSRTRRKTAQVDERFADYAHVAGHRCKRNRIGSPRVDPRCVVATKEAEARRLETLETLRGLMNKRERKYPSAIH